MYTGLGPRTFATETGSFVNLYFFSILVLSHPTCSCHMKLSSHRHYAPSAAPAITLPPHPVWLDAVSPSFPVLPLLCKSLFPRARWHSPSPLCPCWTQDRHALRTVHLIATHPHGCPHEHNPRDSTHFSDSCSCTSNRKVHLSDSPPCTSDRTSFPQALLQVVARGSRCGNRPCSHRPAISSRRPVARIRHT